MKIGNCDIREWSKFGKGDTRDLNLFGNCDSM